ncbi:MAG: thiamine diphosphokinase, partial [Spirochaetaceae bacterium]|nr:thiamine diphosphokinase [Spirochaetaceae bacterium]
MRVIRGIAFIGGEGPSLERCRDLGAEGDIIVAADSGLLLAERSGVKLDRILGDMDSLDDLRRLEKYPPDRIASYPPDKDYTDTELALTFLWGKGCTETWLIGGGGGRTDHLFAIRSLFERTPCPDRWFTAGEDIYCLKDPHPLLLQYGLRTMVSVFPLGEGPWRAKSLNLKWSLNGLGWERGFFGISNVTMEEQFSVSAEQGRFLVLVQTGAGKENFPPSQG